MRTIEELVDKWVWVVWTFTLVSTALVGFSIQSNSPYGVAVMFIAALSGCVQIFILRVMK